ncbi:SDR family oxidoreductase [Pedobacter sp. AW31-3R]|uniref:SDR family oxidoreductase n=1 Tax=Pedobacter sp. AW31-3R TaxID=3445781 RepID=UPI003FA08D00
MTKLKDKVALITGGARGMGLNHVKRFVEEGAKVYFTDLLVEEGQKVAQEYEGKAIFIRQDVSKEEDWKNVIDTIDKNDGKLDILVNNAGILHYKSIENTAADEYMRIIHINQLSVFLGLKYALPALKKSGNASIINVSSIAGIRANMGDVAYASSKFAIKAMTQVAAQEFAQFNIRVNSVHPGLVKTPMAMLEADQSLMQPLIDNTPLKRAASLDEVSNVIVFLSTEDSGFCTAAEFIVDGGVTTGFNKAAKF